MQLIILTNEDGTYEFIEQKRVSSGQETAKYMLRQNDPRKTKWDLVIIFLAIYNSFQIPFELAFEPEDMKATSFVLLNSLIDFFFLLDIIVNFRTTFYDIETGDEVFDSKRTGKKYLKSRFTIDLLSTIPFDNIALLFTSSSSPVLQLFSLLKLVRISRLGRIIERMNVTQDMKNALKLFKLIFVIIIYIHCLACLWYFIVTQQSEWQPPLSYVNPDADFYNSSLANKYFITLYHAVLLLTGNDILPRGTFQVAFVATFITIGAIINANIFGNMALIISDLNKKSAEFQGQIDTANTAMKNMKLPQQIQDRVISYLQYIQQTLNHQNELGEFFKMISPSLKEEVTRFIFSEQLKQNLIFALNSEVKDYVITKIELVMSQPEEIKIQQGEATYDFYIIAKGECECYVKDENRQERFVRTLNPGQHFGEIALLTGSKRTATIQTRNYSTIGMVSQDNFNELLHIFPDIKKKLNDNLVQYQDKYKQWLKNQLLNIVYFQQLRTNTLETLVYKLHQEFFEEG